MSHLRWQPYKSRQLSAFVQIRTSFLPPLPYSHSPPLLRVLCSTSTSLLITMITTSIVALSAFASVASATMWNVSVGAGGALRYNPENISGVAIGDIVRFTLCVWSLYLWALRHAEKLTYSIHIAIPKTTLSPSLPSARLVFPSPVEMVTTLDCKSPRLVLFLSQN